MQPKDYDTIEEWQEAWEKYVDQAEYRMDCDRDSSILYYRSPNMEDL